MQKPQGRGSFKNSQSLRLNKNDASGNCDYTFAVSSRSTSPKSISKNVLNCQTTLNKINLSIREFKEQDINQIINDE
jgi:hypothetical protein